MDKHRCTGDGQDGSPEVCDAVVMVNMADGSKPVGDTRQNQADGDAHGWYGPADGQRAQEEPLSEHQVPAYLQVK